MLLHSKVTGKKRVYLDAKLLIKKMDLTSSFVFSFTFDNSYFNIVQNASDKFEFRIDNKSFFSLLQEQSIININLDDSLLNKLNEANSKQDNR